MSDPHSDFTLSPSSPFPIHCPPALTRDNPAHSLLPHIYMPSFPRLPRLSPRTINREPLDSSPRFATPRSPFSSSLSTSALSFLHHCYRALSLSLSTTTTAAIIYFAPATTTISTAQGNTSSSLPHGASELLEHDILTLLLQTNVEYLSAFVRLLQFRRLLLLSNGIHLPAFEPFLGRRKPAHLATLRQRSTSPDARRHLPLWLS